MQKKIFHSVKTGLPQRPAPGGSRMQSKRAGLSALFLLFATFIFGQQPADTVTKKTDSANADLASRVQAVMKQGAGNSRDEFEQEKKQLQQRKLIDALESNTVKAGNYLKHQLDTTLIANEMKSIENWLKISLAGVSVEKDSYPSYRNLVTTGKLLSELDQRIKTIKRQLDNQEKALTNFRLVSDSLSADSAIYHVPRDSAAILEFLQKYRYLAARLQPADSMLTRALSGIHSLQARTNFMQYKVGGNVEEIEALQRQTVKTLFSGQTSWKATQGKSIKESLQISKTKTLLLLRFYLKHHAGKTVLIIIMLIASTIFLISLKKMQKNANLLQGDFTGRLVIRYPFLSAVLLVFNLFQFIFPDPPFIINLICWTVSALALGFIIRSFISAYWMRFWWLVIILFICAGVSNLILQYTGVERWIILLLAIVGIVTSCFYFFSRQRMELRERLILVFIALAVLFEVCSIVANLGGYFNLAKAFFVCGYCNILIGILFLWTIRLINEGLNLASEVYKQQSPKLFYVNFKRVGTKAPLLLYISLIAGWFILLGRNFYEYQYIAEPLKQFFIAERTVGDYTFAINNILVFFGIMLLAVLASRLTSFFVSEKNSTHSLSKDKRKAGVGSWLLLVRVLIISAGLFLALAASGFPIDRITILIGALGVGIGLGLQNLVNNLVSGLIIAFDRPVNVGDFIEISGHTGTVKSIGFRSSVISSVNGADIVIPNGDLLNAHLVNWTLGGNRRCIDVGISVAYETDLAKVKSLILSLFKEDERVLEYPAPSVWFEGFGDSSINGKVLFWVRDYREASITKSEILMGIDLAFKNNGIKIPFPQRDVHFYDNNTDKKKE